MRLIIEAHLVDDERSTERFQLAPIDRASTTDPLGMSLAEGMALLAAAQHHLVKSQCEGIASAHAHCERCDARLGLKGWHRRQIKTVFGLVNVQSARFRYCRCSNKPVGASFSPLKLVMPTSMTPELEYLQVKWAAHLSYAATCALLSEVLPTADTISVSGVDLTAGSRRSLLAPNGRDLCEEIKTCKWLVWHGKSTKAVARLKHICNAFETVAEEPFFTLWMNLGRLIGYLESNDRYLVNYRRRNYKGLPISSSIAESVVNEVVSWRMAKKRQMRWSDEGAHLLAQIRVRATNGDLYPRAFATPLRPPKPSHKSTNDAYFALKVA